jgi:hypothetical protein
MNHLLARRSPIQIISIDCTDVHTAAIFWQRYLDATEPEGAGHFGRNLDAFWDAIEGGGPGWPGECGLRFINSDALADIPGHGSGSLLDALRQMAKDATQTKIELL